MEAAARLFTQGIECRREIGVPRNPQPRAPIGLAQSDCPVAGVTKFMYDDGVQLGRFQSVEDAFGQQQDRPKNTEDARLPNSGGRTLS